MYDRRPLPAVKQLNAHQDVGDGQLQSGELDALACQTVWPGVDPAAFYEGVREFLDAGLSQILHIVGKLEHYWKAHACEYGCAPQDTELAG